MTVRRRADEWSAVVADLQKRGMTKPQMKEWIADFNQYVNHGNVKLGAAFNLKYGHLLAGDIQAGDQRANFAALRRAFGKALAPGQSG